MSGSEDEKRAMLTKRVLEEFNRKIGAAPDIASARIEHEDPNAVRDFIQNVCEVFEVEDPPGGWPTELGAFIDLLYEGWDKETVEEFAPMPGEDQ